MTGLASYPCEAVAGGRAVTALQRNRLPQTGAPTTRNTARDTHRIRARSTVLAPSSASGAGLRIQRSHRQLKSNRFSQSTDGARPSFIVKASIDPSAAGSSSAYEPSQGLFNLLQKVDLTSLPRPAALLLPDTSPSLNDVTRRISSSVSGSIGAAPGVSEAVSAAQVAATSAWGSVSGTAAGLAERAAAVGGAAATALSGTSGAFSSSFSTTSDAFSSSLSNTSDAFAASVSSVASAASAAGSAAQSAATSPAAVAKLLSSESSVLQDFQDLVRLAGQDSVSAVRGAVSSLASAVTTSPSFVRLETAGAKTFQDAADVASRIQSASASLAARLSEDPGAVLSSLATAAEAAPSVLGEAVNSALAQAEATPGAVPAAAVGGAAVTALLLNSLVTSLRDAQVKGKELPSRYDPDSIAAYFKLRPGTVIARSLSVFAQCSRLVASIYVDRARGLEKENEELRAKQTVDLITRLGPTAIKVGQALSIRPDLLSLAYLEQLQTLQDRVASFSNEEARSIIEEGLGKSSDEVFMDMSPSPVAAASLGQVYKAKLRKTGDTVAVKVQRPGVLEGICCDLLVLRIMAKAFQKLPYVHTDLLDVLDTWARRFFDELDYIQEGKNALRFASDMAEIQNVTVPTVFMDYTSRKVLTTGWVEGEKLSECQSADLGTLVTTALNCYLIQLLETGFLHADPHPGNLLRTPDGRLCVLDFGLMTEVTVEQQYALIEYISHLVNSDYERVAEDLVVLGFVPPELVDPEKTAAVVPQLSRVLGQLTQGGGAKKINVAQVTDDLAKLSSDYVFVIPPYFALILRAFGVLEGIGLDHDPDYSIVDECYPYISKRLLTDDSPRARSALRYFLYGKEDKLNVTRVEELAQGLLTFRDLMAAGAAPDSGAAAAAAVKAEEASGSPALSARAALAAAERRGGLPVPPKPRSPQPSGSITTSTRTTVSTGNSTSSAGITSSTRSLTGSNRSGSRGGQGVDPTARQVLAAVFAEKGSYLQELLFTELVKTVDALSREALAEQWSFLATRSPLSVPAALLQPGTYPLPLLLPGAVAQLARGRWATASLSEEDQATLSTVRRLWAFLEPQLEASTMSPLQGPSNPAELLPWLRETAPVVQDMLPGVLTSGTRFLAMLAQRQALRLADDLDGGKSVEEWDLDPYAFARTIQPRATRSRKQQK